jgi:hypothetical protein
MVLMKQCEQTFRTFRMRFQNRNDAVVEKLAMLHAYQPVQRCIVNRKAMHAMVTKEMRFLIVFPLVECIRIIAMVRSVERALF